MCTVEHRACLNFRPCGYARKIHIIGYAKNNIYTDWCILTVQLLYVTAIFFTLITIIRIHLNINSEICFIQPRDVISVASGQRWDVLMFFQSVFHTALFRNNHRIWQSLCFKAKQTLEWMNNWLKTCRESLFSLPSLM